MPSEAVARDIVQAGAPEQAVSVIPLGSDILPDPDDVGAAALLERLGVRGEFLLSVGTLEPRKNLARLFEAYGVARRSLPEPWPLVVVGPPGWGPEPERGEGVVFTGRVGDGTLASLYARARLLAYVPFEEGFGLPPVEAMRYGTPVVASPLPTTGGASFEVDPNRADDIAQALVAVATDDGLRGAADRGRHGARRESHVGVRGACARRAVELPAMSTPAPDEGGGVLALSLDVSAVPAQPVGAGRYTIDLATALLARTDVALTLWSRRGDGARWAELGSRAARGAGPRKCGRARRRAGLLAWHGSSCGCRPCSGLVRSTCTTVPITRCPSAPGCRWW